MKLKSTLEDDRINEMYVLASEDHPRVNKVFVIFRAFFVKLKTHPKATATARRPGVSKCREKCF